MQLQTTVPVHHTPDLKQPSVLQLGLQSLDPRQWMQVDTDFPQFHAHKSAMGRHDLQKVYRALPESTAAQTEFHQVLTQHLLNDHSSQFSLEGEKICLKDSALTWPQEFSSLWQSALMVQEDICLLQKLDKDYILSAASLCSPSNWKLEDKIGQTLDYIHDPVPGYQQQLAARVNRLFDRLKVDSPLLRFNWSIQANSELCWRDDYGVGGAPSLASNVEDWYWRVERQTLRRLPKTGAIVFAIRIFIHPFSAFENSPYITQIITEILKRLPADQVEYKGLGQCLNKFA